MVREKSNEVEKKIEYPNKVCGQWLKNWNINGRLWIEWCVKESHLWSNILTETIDINNSNQLSTHIFISK